MLYISHDFVERPGARAKEGQLDLGSPVKQPRVVNLLGLETHKQQRHLFSLARERVTGGGKTVALANIPADLALGKKTSSACIFEKRSTAKLDGQKCFHCCAAQSSLFTLVKRRRDAQVRRARHPVR